MRVRFGLWALVWGLGASACAPVLNQDKPLGLAQAIAPTGTLRGFVYGKGEASQPLGLVVVQAFNDATRVTTWTGNLPETAQALLPSELAPDDGKRLFLLHAFDDNQDGQPDGPAVAVERVPVEKLADGPAGPRWRYQYLRPGEFILEGVPSGSVSVSAYQWLQRSEVQRLDIAPRSLTQGLRFELEIPAPISIGVESPHVVDWVQDPSPANPTFHLEAEQAQSELSASNAVRYEPASALFGLSLVSPAGSVGAVVRAASVVYGFPMPDGHASADGGASLGPILIPIPMTTVPPGGDIRDGASVQLQLPLASAALSAHLRSLPPADWPKQVDVQIELIDESGFAIQSRGFENLHVSTSLRRM